MDVTGGAAPRPDVLVQPGPAHPARTTDADLRRRLSAAVRGRLQADEEPEHTRAGDRLLARLLEARRRAGGRAA